jgi:LuxR family transcriptional regulator, regulator of acetate metabolism
VTARATQDTARLLGELRQLHRELVELDHVRRSDGLENVAEAVRRLGEVGSPAGIVARSARELGERSDFDRVLLSRVEGGRLVPAVLWWRGDEAAAARALEELARRPVALGYPLVEAEVAQRQQAAVVPVAASGRRAAPALAEVMGWDAYAVAAVAPAGATAGLLHVARAAGGRAVDEVDRELAARYAGGLAQVLERARLREQVQRHHAQLRSAGRWINGQMLKLSAEASPARDTTVAREDSELAAILTPRELEVLRLVAGGRSNRGIATALTLGEGTVKYHVKNILRKLQARSRTEAVSRYMRLYGGAE